MIMVSQARPSHITFNICHQRLNYSQNCTTKYSPATTCQTVEVVAEGKVRIILLNHQIELKAFLLRLSVLAWWPW